MKIRNLHRAIFASLLALALAGCAGTTGSGGAARPAAQATPADVPQATAAQSEAEALRSTQAAQSAAPQIAPALEGTHAVEKSGPVRITEPAKATPETPPAGDARIARDPIETGPQAFVPEAFVPEAFQTWCMFAGTGATMGIDGERLNFTCSQAGEVMLGLFGDIQPGADGWTIARKSFQRGADGFVGLGSEMARIEAVLLQDGMRCQWAGGASKQTFAGKPVTFTCRSETGAEYVLLGEVALGDDGWLIERGVLIRGGDGPGTRLEKIAPILIDALAVRK